MTGTFAFADLPTDTDPNAVWVALYENDHAPRTYAATTAKRAAREACKRARSDIPPEQTHWDNRRGAFVLAEYEEFGLDRYQESIVVERRPLHGWDDE